MEADGRLWKTIVFGRLVLKRDVDWAQTTSTGGVGGGVTETPAACSQLK